jgi:3-hydroxyisobutyrate dehydrogenase-like beta-hydroxyacid dehydrogenase
MNETEKLGYIGVGAMGGALARKLMRAGRRLVVCDKNPEAIEAFRAAGAEIAETPREVADKCRIVFACLPSPPQSILVATGTSDGVTHGKAIKIYVEHSTLGATTIDDIDHALKTRGIAVLDAPITGGAGGEHGVSRGDFAVLSSGAREAFDELAPIFAELTPSVFYFGEKTGLAQIAKVINNALSITALTISCEAIVMGVKAGLDPKTLLDAINAGSGRNSATLDKFPRAILPRKFDKSPMSIGLKDLQLYMETMRDHGLPSPVGASVMEVWNAAVAQKGKNRGYNSIIEHFEQFAHVEVKG